MKVIKIPFGGGGLSHGKGSKDAPDAIQAKLKDIVANESHVIPNFQFDEVKVDNNNIEESHNNILNKVKSLNEKSIILGGDHSITYPSFKAFAQNHPEAGIVVFDAHPDLLEHAGVKSQEDWLRALINEGIVDKDRVIIISVRNTDRIEKEFIDENKLQVYYMKNIYENKVENVCHAIMEKIRTWPSVYLSIDIDAVDPAFAPGTGYNEPGGLTSREMIYFIQKFNLLKNLKMIDIVEVDPNLDNNNLTTKLAAKLMTELCKDS